MGEDGGPYLFDVGVVALAHADTPVSDRALSYVQDAIRGDIDAVVPYPVVFGTHVVLTEYYGFSAAAATEVLSNFMDAERIDWRADVSESVVRSALGRASAASVDAWDGYYADVALADEVTTVLTLDNTLERVEGVSTEVILSPAEFAILNDFLSP